MKQTLVYDVKGKEVYSYSATGFITKQNIDYIPQHLVGELIVYNFSKTNSSTEMLEGFANDLLYLKAQGIKITVYPGEIPKP